MKRWKWLKGKSLPTDLSNSRRPVMPFSPLRKIHFSRCKEAVGCSENCSTVRTDMKDRFFKQDRQCTYKRSSETPLSNHSLPWKSNKCCMFWVSISSLSCRACVVLYCHLWPVSLGHIFPYYLISRTIFEKKKINEHKIYSDFLYDFV